MSKPTEETVIVEEPGRGRYQGLQQFQEGAKKVSGVVYGGFSDFSRFLQRGNVMDLAVGVVMGAAFTAIVNSFVQDLVTPVIGLALQSNLQHSLVVIHCKRENGTKVDVNCFEGRQSGYSTVAIANAAGAVTWNWFVILFARYEHMLTLANFRGNFLQAVFNFLITGFIVYLLVKTYAATFLKVRPPPPKEKTKSCEFCLEDIKVKAKRCKFCGADAPIPHEDVALTSPAHGPPGFHVPFMRRTG
ncbi:hypothetical protein HK101_007407 [Irineochytrium annulatum]|nr:hypothetical protein HK101_007407 [Irineochytrium annulatum]